MKTIHFLPSLLIMVMLTLFSCKKDSNTPVQQSQPVPTTEQKVEGYYWRCDSMQVMHYINGNWAGYNHPAFSQSLLNLATDHNYTWDNSPVASAGTWSVTDETHLRMDGVNYIIQSLADHTLNLYGERTWTSGTDVYTDKMYLYFSK